MQRIFCALLLDLTYAEGTTVAPILFSLYIFLVIALTVYSSLLLFVCEIACSFYTVIVIRILHVDVISHILCYMHFKYDTCYVSGASSIFYILSQCYSGMQREQTLFLTVSSDDVR